MNNLTDQKKLDIQFGSIGVGTWAWGDKSVWGYGKGYSDTDLREAFDTSVASGVTFFDTAELYGFGKSERLLGQFIHSSKKNVIVATKYFPVPWRLSRRSVVTALRKSLRRLDLPSVDLCQIHWPFHLLSIPSMMDALSEAVHEGLTKSVGVSNYNRDQMHRACDALSARGIPLASNQVEYSILHRNPETNGVLQGCRQLGVRLIAYSPLAMGMLTGKYSSSNLPSGYRGMRYRRMDFRAFTAMLSLLREAGAAHGGKSVSQVALNWLIANGALPIPGAKNGRQAAENAGARGWSLTAGEVSRIDGEAERTNR